MNLSEKYINIFPEQIDKKEELLDYAWNLVQIAYEPTGGYLGDKMDLVQPNVFWKCVRRNGKIIAIQFYKIIGNSRKMFCCAHDGSQQGKAEVKKMMYDDLNLKGRNAWVEVSGGPERTYTKKGYIPLPVDMSEKILRSIGKEIISKNPDGYHYTRKIGGEPHEKVIFGNPPLVNNDISEGFNLYNFLF